MTISLNGSTAEFDAVVAEHVAEDQAAYDEMLLDGDPYCELCGRCTDHVGEHDGATLAGLAEYPSHTDRNGQRWSLGQVRYTDRAWDLMVVLGRAGVRTLAGNLDTMEYEAWRSGAVAA